MTNTDYPEGHHPLEFAWTIWYDSYKKQDEGEGKWEENLLKVSDFKTVEEFWSTYNHIKRPTSLEYGANYHVFKQGIKPMWEDVANKNGGRFVVVIPTPTVPKREDSQLNETWEHLFLALIGENIEDGLSGEPPIGGHVTGAVLGRRKQQAKLAVWTRDKDNQLALNEIEANIKKLLQLDQIPDSKISYQPHEKEATKN